MLPVPTKITKVEAENGIVKTFYFESDSYCMPGQFYMVWVPGFEEKPMSVSGIRPLSITIAAAGPASKRMTEYKEGERMFLRGPLGKGFRLEGKSVLGIGGGYGFGPIRHVLSEMQKKGAKAKAILGARHKGLLLNPAPCETIMATNDGSAGKQGLATDAFLGLLSQGEKFDMVYTCGPERMMKAVAEICSANKIGCQMLLERYMKCAVGACGQCVIGEGMLVCRDGPMFGLEALSFRDFGFTKLDRKSARVPI